MCAILTLRQPFRTDIITECNFFQGCEDYTFVTTISVHAIMNALMPKFPELQLNSWRFHVISFKCFEMAIAIEAVV